MKKKLTALLLTLVMLLSLIVPASADAGTDGDVAVASTDPVAEDVVSTTDDEASPEDADEPEDEAQPEDTDEPEASPEDEAEALADGDPVASLPATHQEALIALLLDAGLAEAQLTADPSDTEQLAYDCVELYKSMGVLPSDYSAEEECTQEWYDAVKASLKPLYDALDAGKLQPLFMNGMAQPIFPYTSGIPTEDGYSNDESDITRFCVYVETNYDTDGDGALDLVKTLVQLPKSAAEGNYKAATIYEARPYITGCTNNKQPTYNDGFDLKSMYSKVPARVPARYSTTTEQAASANSEDWYYYNPLERSYCFEDLTWYDYYLVRGFAVVECGGLGTMGSDGFETCGTDLEIDAFKCVIEWLHGDRVAYTNRTDNIAIKADWSNGKVGMTGRSYAGTTQFGLSTTGVAGLETIVPVAGIASWYEYSKSQGAVITQKAYSQYLAKYCNGRYIDSEDYANIQEGYGNYLGEITNEENALNGDYGHHWAIRDYTVAPLLSDWTGIHIPALIVHGLNDTNVKTKQFDLMYKTFKNAGQNVKILLHQGTHLTPTYPAQEYELLIDGEYYDSILNKWFSHYLYGVRNGIESMANVTVQSNVDGSWTTYNSWDTAYKAVLRASSATDDATSDVLGGVRHRDDNNKWVVDTAVTPATYTYDVPEDFTIQGPVAVHIRAAATPTGETPLSELDNIRLTVGLNDKSETNFNAFVPSGSYLPITSKENSNAWMGGGVKNFALVSYIQASAKSKSIGLGYIDVFNPTAGYNSASSATRTELEDGRYYDYTVYIQPTAYTVKEGHTLELTITLANYCGLDLQIDNSKTYIDMPTHSRVSFSESVPGSNSDVGGGGGGGTGSGTTPSNTTTNGDGSTTKTETKTDGTTVETTTKTDGSKIEVETKTDGTKTTTETDGKGNESTTVEKTDGSKSVDVKQSDGTTASTTVSSDGKTEADVKLSVSAVEKAEGSSIVLPIPEVEVDRGSSESSVTVKVSVPDTVQSENPVRVTVPVADIKSGDVAVIVNPDGSETVVKKSVATDDGLSIPLEGGATIKIVNNSKEFDDTSDHWSHDAVGFVTSRELFKGVSDDSFAPNEAMDRAMLVTVLHRLEDTPVGGQVSFPDVNGSTWYTEAVAWASEKNIVTGYSDGSFGPNDQITREQIAAILYRYAATQAVNTNDRGTLANFADGASTSFWAQDSMSWAVGIGLFQGSNGRLEPQKSATRAEVAVILQRFVEYMAS